MVLELFSNSNVKVYGVVLILVWVEYGLGDGRN